MNFILLKYLKVYLILLCSIASLNLYAQVSSDLLVTTHSVSTIEMTGITPTVGALAFNTNDARVYEYVNNEWLPMSVPRTRVTTITGNYTLTVADNNTILAVNSATDITLTVPSGITMGPNATSTGYNVLVYQIGTGKVIVSPALVGIPVLLNNRLNRFTTAGQDAGISIISIGTDVYTITGDLRQ